MSGTDYGGVVAVTVMGLYGWNFYKNTVAGNVTGVLWPICRWGHHGWHGYGALWVSL